MPAIWNIGAPTPVQVFGFRNSIGGAPITNATLTGKLLNHNKTEDVADSNFDIPLVAGNDYGGVSPIQDFDQNTLMWLEIEGRVNGTVIYRQHFEVVAGYGTEG
jgi:hypothetical protein